MCHEKLYQHANKVAVFNIQRHDNESSDVEVVETVLQRSQDATQLKQQVVKSLRDNERERAFEVDLFEECTVKQTRS